MLPEYACDRTLYQVIRKYVNVYGNVLLCLGFGWKGKRRIYRLVVNILFYLGYATSKPPMGIIYYDVIILSINPSFILLKRHGVHEVQKWIFISLIWTTWSPHILWSYSSIQNDVTILEQLICSYRNMPQAFTTFSFPRVIKWLHCI